MNRWRKILYCFPGFHRTEFWGWLDHWWASLMVQMVKNLLTMQETWVLSPSQEDPLEKGMATHSIILAWRITWTEKPGGLYVVHGSQKVEKDWETKWFSHFHFSSHCHLNLCILCFFPFPFLSHLIQWGMPL